ncbi:unnamed protein product [Amoebophrya sp. A25]|nr:unnamed protein product [Amoebophrya sp. A25]|eukprot:GSA25T00016771001.1
MIATNLLSCRHITCTSNKKNRRSQVKQDEIIPCRSEKEEGCAKRSSARLEDSGNAVLSEGFNLRL